MSSSAQTTDYKALMKNAVVELRELRSKLDAEQQARSEPIAIIGAGCRFPGEADSPDAFWKLLSEGGDAITDVPEERWRIDDYYDPDPTAPGKICTRRGGFLDRIFAFDPHLFNIVPREAESMDPQQRLLLEVSWQALEHANLAVDRLYGSNTGVFVGISTFDNALLKLGSSSSGAIDAYCGTGNALSAANGRLAYVFGFTGPSLSIDTACSSSLVSVHTACQSLRNRECNLALAGGVNAILSPAPSINFSQAGMLAPDGRCKTFDESANGYVRGEGCGMLVLKRLSDARADGDQILALIRGSAVNQDGPSGGLTVPNGPSQVAVINRALASAGVKPEEVVLVEAHGTGTSLGDPIEINALAGSLCNGQRSENDRLLVGSVKTNIGHTEAAAGVAGILKVTLALVHGEIPPHLHFNKPNSHVRWDQIPIEVVTRLQPWPAGRRRIAGVSSFGFSGTNAHVILEEAPPEQPSEPTESADRPFNPLALSARSEAALSDLAQQYADHIENHAEQAPADICHTANSCRSQMEHRLAVVGGSGQELVAQLAARSRRQPSSGLSASKANSTAGAVFLFTGQGSQYPGMGSELLAREPVFREALEQCDELLRSHMEQPLLEVIYGDCKSCELLDQTRYTQPALFALEYALVKLWATWGIEPAAVAGHSVGEYVAACVAGVMSLEDGLALIAQRADLMQSLPAGTMAAVFCSRDQAAEAIRPVNGAVAIAAVNAPELVVISGASAPVQAALDSLTGKGVGHQLLRVSHAFHSPMVEEISEPFLAMATGFQYHPPRLPLISNLSGEQIADDEVLDADYWRRHLLSPVQYQRSIESLAAAGHQVFLEIGPQPVLTGLARRSLPDTGFHWAASLIDGEDDSRQMLTAAAELYEAGIDLDWQAVDRPFLRRRVALPCYPFQHRQVRNQPELTLGSGQPAPTPQPTAVPSEPPAVGGNQPDRCAALVQHLQSIIHSISGLAPEVVDADANLFSLGLDSIMLVRLRQAVEQDLGASFSMSELHRRLKTVRAIAAHLDQVLPPDVGPAGSSQPAASVSDGDSLLARLGEELQRASLAGGNEVSHLIEQQLELMTLQLQTLSRGGGSPTRQPALKARPASVDRPATASSLPYRPLGTAGELAIREQQQQHLDALVRAYSAKTQGSKELTQAYRPVFANVRNIAGFRPEWKELIYQIIVDRASGARFHDIDGREYLDMTMGFGVYLFGHNPDFIHDALQDALTKGAPIGPMCRQAGEVARQIHQLTGVERVAFFNTGTEAVMTAVRLARTVTGRSKIVMFSGSYHGHTDNLLAIGHGQETIPMVPGTPFNMVQDTYVLDYDKESSLDFIEAHGSELAAVLVEPVQSRRPDLQPKEFLHKLRELTSLTGTALIFDEVILGFRLHPGGAQAWFDVEADIVTYGKLVGGGMPIGIVAGRAEYLDAIDGGMWQYGDDSAPPHENTFIAGTFNHHPLAMAAANAVLDRLITAGPHLQEGLNQTTQRLAQRLNHVFEKANVPIRMVHCGSLFRFDLHGEHELLCYHLIEKGIYIWEGRNCFISTAHSEADLDLLVAAVEQSVDEMIAGGFFAEAEATSTAIEPRQEPLSSAQRRIYVLSQLEGGELAYHIPVAVTIEGTIDLVELQAAVATIVERHEAFRTSFDLAGGEVVQTVHPAAELTVEQLTAGEDELDEVIARFIRPFDLTQPPLARMGVIRLDEQRQVLIFDAHHIVYDGISGNILFAELTQLLSGEPLASRAARYHDYVRQEQAYLESAEYARDREFWLDRLAGEYPVLELPIAHPRPPQRSFAGQRIFHRLDRHSTEAVKSLSRSSGATLHMVLLAAHFVLLHKLTGACDIVVGTTFDGRSDEALQSVIGMFVNTIAIRNRPEGSKTFSQLLDEVRESVLAAHDHQRYPFELLIDDLGLVRQGDRNPLFDTALVFESMGTATITAGGLSFTQRDISNRTAVFDMTHEIVEIDGSLTLSMEYRTDLFEPSTIERLLDCYCVILDDVSRHPDRTIMEINTLSADERTRLLHDLNATSADYPQGKTIVDLFEEQVARTPDHTALILGDQTLSYAGLDQRASRVASYLIASHELETGELIGLLMPRSGRLIECILGVLKAGCAYLPIDPDYPRERKEYILQDSGCRLLLYAPGADQDLQHDGIQAVDVSTIKDVKKTVRQRSSGGSTSAYVIYTSGSTGKPKGCLVTNRNVVRLMKNSRFSFDFDEHDVWIMAHSHCFDFSVWEMYGALLYGASLVVPDKESVRDPASLHAMICRHRVTVLNQVPGAFVNFIQEELKRDGNELESHLRYVIFGGDRLLTGNLKPWCERYSPDTIQLVNMYGITETTVHVTYCRLTTEMIADTSTSPIGVPLPETKVYILDNDQALLPIGVIGEIWVGGTGVCNGYLNQPGLTAERFVENPYQQGERLYRTGDLGRWREDGTLEYIGRNDDQVQIRGHRIEPREIVSHLLAHPELEQAHVTATIHTDERPELIAYIVTRRDSEHEPSERELRQHLGAKIPEYMVPTHFVAITELPLTSSGKIDKQRLPLPGANELATGTVYEAPRNDIEQVLVESWESVLGRTGIGIRDSFFELGGDSIKAIQVVAGIQQQGYRLHVRDLFQAPELADLATKVTREERLVAQGPVTGRVPLTPIQTWFLGVERAQPHHYNQSLLLCSNQRLQEQALRAVLGKLQDHHDILRARLCHDESGMVLQQAGLDHPLSFDVVDLREVENPEQLIHSHANQVQAGIDLEHGPLLRAVLFRLDQSDRLLVVIHHLVVDGVSWRILIDDIALGYQQYLERGTIELPPKTDSYQAWSRQVDLARKSGLFAAEEKHWQTVEAAATEPLPSDRPGGDNLVESSQRLTFELDQKTTSDLLTSSGDAYSTTVECLLLTALARALQRHWSRQRITVYLEGHGRDTGLAEVDISRTVGWFTTLYPVVLDLAGSEELGDQICQVKESLRQVPSGGFGYCLLRYFDHGPSLPRPQLIFNYLGQFDEIIGQGLLRVKEGAGDPVSLVNVRDCELEVEAMVIDAKLRMSITFSTDSYLKETIDRLLTHLEHELTTVLDHCLDQDQCRLTPSDLTYPGLSLTDLDQLLVAAGIKPGNLQDVCGLSPLQEGMLFHNLVDTSSHAYVLQIAFSIRGELDMARFEQSWNLLVARHDALRTAFLQRGSEQPLQLVLRERQVPFYHEDISCLDQQAQADRLRDLRQSDLEQGFDLSQDQLMRIAVLQRAADAFEVVWSSHHILFDGWCLAGLTEELVALYQALEQGAIPDLPQPPSYTTYIEWLQCFDKEAAKRFWSSYLQGFKRPTHLPRAGKERRSDFRQVAFELSSEASNQLAELAATNRVTLSTIVRAVWGALLSKHTAADDVAFGVTVSGRPAELADVEQMIGLFINTVPLRIRLQADLPFTELLRNMQEEWLASEPHHYLSLADIQSLSAPGRDLLDHVLVFENYPHAEELRCGENALRSHFSIESVEVTELTSYSFIVVAYPGTQLRIELRYDSAVYCSEMVDEMRAQMISTLEAVAESPEIRVGALVWRLLSEDEKQERDSFMRSVMTVDEDF